MIISASRRTDIPAFYTPWFMNRIRAGFCLVPNPYNPRQMSRVSLVPAEVDAIVFWTRNPRPLLPHLRELDDRGYRSYFQFTILGYPRALDPRSPSLAASVAVFQRLAEQVGPERIVWRYDPIVFTGLTPPAYHEEQYGRLAALLRGYSRRSVVSLVDLYRKTRRRLDLLAGTPAQFQTWDSATCHALLSRLDEIARVNGFEIKSCAEEEDWTAQGIRPGKCVDPQLLGRVFGLTLKGDKDPRQRPACGCTVSRDIGIYDTCPLGCAWLLCHDELRSGEEPALCARPRRAPLVPNGPGK